jgi:hypothetical protein
MFDSSTVNVSIVNDRQGLNWDGESHEPIPIGGFDQQRHSGANL